MNASEVARAAGLHRGTAYNILRTLQAEGFVGYDEATRSYSVSLHILETRLWRVAAQRVDGPGASADARGFRCARRVGLSVQGAGAVVAAAAGLGRRGVPSRSVRHRRAAVSRPGGRIGRHHGGLRKQQRAGTRSAVLAGRLVPEAVLSPISWRGSREAKQSGFAVDRGTMFRGVTLVSVPVLSPSWELLLILTAAGHSHDLDDDAVGAAEPRDAIGGGAAFGECAIAASRVR